jgi:thiol-disulfide isomerase/thioredoxin
MKIRIKNIFACIIGLAVFNVVFAQQDTVTMRGTFAEKINAELYLIKTVNSKIQKLGVYTINPSNPDFVFVFPADTTINYSFQVKTLKQGHMRLEADKWFTLPLTMKPGQNYSLKVIPSRLDVAKKTGWELKTDTGKSSIAFVSGELVNWNLGGEMTFQRVVDGSYETINSVSIPKGEKSFLLPCLVKQEGFYYLGSVRWKLRIYLKPGDKLDLSVDARSGYYELVNGSEENHMMQKWQELIRPITSYGYNATMIRRDSMDVDAYLRAYEDLESRMLAFRNNINPAGSRFERMFRMAMDVDNEFAPILYLLNAPTSKMKGFGSSPRDFKEVPETYRRFAQPGKLENAAIFNIGEARQYMNLYTKLVVAFLPDAQKQKLDQAEKLGLMIGAIGNDTLISYFLKDKLSEIEINNLTEFRATFEPYKKYAKTTSVKKKYLDVYNQYSSDTAYVGKFAYNFSLPDSSGRMISMKDFKGKVVFIDVWATWCGPCREQFPYLKVIEEEYKDNKDIVFLGISIDQAKDRQKWLNVIKKENLHGVQLLDDIGKSFARKYEISGIPRFLLISKEGKWIEVRCPRPGSKEDLKRYLDKALKETSLTHK